MALNQPNVNGQASSANSSPVVLPNDYASTTTSKIGDGTNTVNVLKSDGTAAGQNAELVAPATQTLNFTTSSAGAQVILANTNVTNYAWIEVVFTSVGVGLALNGQFSTISGGTYVTAATFSSSNLQAVGVLGTAVNRVYTTPVMGNFFQLTLTALTSGTFAGTVTLRAGAPPAYSQNVSQAGTWTIGANSATGSATPANAHLMGASDGTNLTALRMSSADATSQANLLSSQAMIYNGTNFDRPRNATTASGTTGTGVVAAGGMRLGKTANPTAVTDGQQVEALADKLGKQVVVGSLRDLKADTSITLTSTTTETTLIAAIASTFNDLYGLIIENISATATEVSFRDVTAGTVRFSIYVPAGDTRGFMLPESAAWKQATVNTAWTAQCTTSVASIKIAAMYVKNT